MGNILIFAAFGFTEKPNIRKFSITDILNNLNPTEIVDIEQMAPNILCDRMCSCDERFEYWFIHRKDSNSNENLTELKDLYNTYDIFDEAAPEFMRIMKQNDDGSFVIAFHMTCKEDISNLVQIRFEIIRMIQFLQYKGYSRDYIVNYVKEFLNLAAVKIDGDKNNKQD